jgi:asparagine synthase (glutamine-hydrolysing)
MSGIVGLLNLNGAPIDRTVLERLTNFLRFRGPDAQRIWFRGPIGLGHTLLKPEAGSGEDHQPLSVDGSAWIVCDARLDGRRDLIALLQSCGQPCSPGASDAELILGAYKVWGGNCLAYLLGDFSFAIWDAPRRRLFCARDQMGVKPFFYARLGSLFFFSNTLNCLRQHSAVSDRLNELSIADFLLFDMIRDPAATAFADIRRLAPAHALVCEQKEVSIRRYWSPPASEPLLYQRREDYVDHFRELFDTAVADRLPSGSACILMSGGLDSSAVATSARRAASATRNPNDLWALTQVFDRLIPHDERYYAGLVGQALKIPVEYRSDDDLTLFQLAEDPERSSPEPVHSAWPDQTVDHLKHVAIRSRVALTGFGADPMFSSRITVHFRELLQQRRLGRALADAAAYLFAEKRLSRLYLRTRCRLLFGSKEMNSGFFPEWLNPDFARRLRLRERWENMGASAAPPPCPRPEAYTAVLDPFWPALFESYDPGTTRVPVEVRHPFFDLRLTSFLLALPRLPWCSDKQLLREAGRGVLPDEVRLRRKSPLEHDPLLVLLQRPEAAIFDRFDPVPELERFVVHSRIPSVRSSRDSWSACIHLRPLSLNYWLKGSSNRTGSTDASCAQDAPAEHILAARD